MSVFADAMHSAFDAHNKTVSNTTWLAAHNSEAFARTNERGLPTTREEDWKYTRLNSLEQLRFQFVSPDPTTLDIEDFSTVGFSPLNIVFIDGNFNAALSNLANCPAGLRVTDLALACREPSTALTQQFTGLGEPTRHYFKSLNSAFLQAGVLIEIEADKIIDTPLHLMFISSGKQSAMASPRILLHAERHSRCVIIESFQSLADSVQLTNVVTEIKLDAEATVDHYRVQNEAEQAFHFGHLHASLNKNSVLNSHSFAFGAVLSRQDIQINLAAHGAAISLNGLACGRGKQHMDHHTVVDHMAEHTVSRQNYKGIADDHSRGVFNGKVIVRKHAQKIDAVQSSRNLLLSSNAEIDTKPELQIYADDVKCAHGATVGQLDGDALFYLRSRGIKESAARTLLTLAFAGDVIEAVEIPKLRDWLRQTVETRIGSTRAGGKQVSLDS